MEALDLHALEQRRADQLAEEVRLKEVQLSHLRTEVANLKKRRTKPGVGRALGPDNYLSVDEMCAELPLSAVEIQQTLDEALGQVRLLRKRWGRGVRVVYHWGDAQRVLVTAFGEAPKRGRQQGAKRPPPAGSFRSP